MLDDYLRKAGIAHDVRGLMSRAYLAVEFLESHKDDAVQRQADRIFRALEQVMTICLREFEDPLKHSAVRRQTVDDLTQLVDEVMVVTFAQCYDKKCSISTEVTVDPDVELNIDPHKIFRALFNLVSNAATALADHGGKRLSVDIQETGGVVTFQVSDNGPGLPKHVMGLLYPVGHTSSPRRGRIGTGLVTAAELAKDLGGELILKSTSAAGTVFQLQVPVDAETNAVEPSPVLFAVQGSNQIAAHQFAA